MTSAIDTGFTYESPKNVAISINILPCNLTSPNIYIPQTNKLIAILIASATLVASDLDTPALIKFLKVASKADCAGTSRHSSRGLSPAVTS
ncbi:hypothetical protein GCM10025878_02170 [Leuconostoc gasicomitatum]|nr:hypothetical protein GCM10025878_02170 [Leuconostoc gasicomitatum]